MGYSAHFLRSISGDFDVASRRGVVESMRNGQFARIRWDDGETNLAHVSNVARVGSVAFSDPHVKPR